jgi:hypothetical protein
MSKVFSRFPNYLVDVDQDGSHLSAVSSLPTSQPHARFGSGASNDWIASRSSGSRVARSCNSDIQARIYNAVFINLPASATAALFFPDNTHGESLMSGDNDARMRFATELARRAGELRLKFFL